MDENVIKIIQKRFRFLRKQVYELNRLSNKYYQILNNLTKHLENSFEKDLISQYLYISTMEKIEKSFELYQTVPRPVRINNLEKIYWIRFINLKTRLIEITNIIGSDNINEIIWLNFNKNINNIFPSNSTIKYRQKEKDKNEIDYLNLLIFYNQTFTPTSVVVYDLKKIRLDERQKINEDDYYYYDNRIVIKLTRPYCRPLIKKKISLLENIHGTRLYIPVFSISNINQPSQVIVMNGVFEKDSLNISRYGGTLGKKNNELKKMINDLGIDSNFKKGYLEQLSLRDFIMYSTQEISEKCLLAFNEAKHFSKKNHSEIIKEFKDADLERQRYILTIFLLSKNVINLQFLAYLLYDFISNENHLTKHNNIAYELYNSLDWSIQKLFKVAINKSTEYTKKLSEFNHEEMSYEKRICLLKTDDKIKAKAIEKYKELSCKTPNDDTSKVKQYLDNLLRIPFGIYRKEKIISFLESFKDEIASYVTISHKIFNDYVQEIKEKNTNINQINILLDDYISRIKNKNVNSNTINVFLKNISKESQNLLSLRIKSFTLLNEKELDQEIDKLCHNLKVPNLKSLIKDLNNKLSKENNKGLRELKISSKSSKKNLTNNLKIFLKKIPDLHTRHLYLEEIEKKAHQNSLIIDSKILRSITQFQVLENKWIKYQNDYQTYLQNVDQTLDQAVYGQSEAKQQIKRIIAQWINGQSTGYCFGFEGSPGVGKTSLAKKGISDCLKDDDGTSRPFSFIGLGGTSNGSYLEGHGYTYVKSKWGKILDVLMDSNCMNPIIYIDELDKVSKTEQGKEIIGILTHLTDPSQNDQFMDKYYDGIKIDLSQVLFIFSYNDYSLLDPILADRIHRVKFNNLDLKDKIKIVNDYIMPELLKTVGFDQTDITIENDIIEYIIRNYTYEAGVRKLKEKLFEIIREINLRYLMDRQNNPLPIQITLKLIDDVFSGKPKLNIKKITDRPYIGRVNGLYATSSGLGGLAIIESYQTPSDTKLSLVLTGQQGDVMKESMRVAQTVAWNLLPIKIQNQIKDDMKNNGNFGIHIHCPEAATPKDGPSGGCAITLAIVSTLTKIPIKNTVAMTGEIDLNGQVHAIGGLSDKIQGAIEAGVSLVLCPKENENELKIAKEKINFDQKIEVQMIENIWQVLELTLMNNQLNFSRYSNPNELD